ncbi:hypothetical protein PBI_ZEECULATE_77 [Mycobacterium phage Zeeculate]|nr:hypothetical protein PBI_ZEECULATE_77 [Mycobacterium phage Zeeculate]
MNPELRTVLTEAQRDEIAKAISAHRLWNGRCEACGETSRHESRHMADAAVEVLASLPGVAVIQLPKPDEREDEEQEFTDFPGVGLYVPVVFDRHPGEVQIRAGAWCDEPLSVDEARGLAASILAAASYAEEAEE